MSTPWLSSSSSGASSMALLSSPTVWNTQKGGRCVCFFFFFRGGGGTDHGKGKRDGKMIKVEPKKKSFCQITDGFPSHFSGVFFVCVCVCVGCFESTSTSGSLMITWPSGVSGSLCPCLRFHGPSSTGRWKTRRARLFCESSGPNFQRKSNGRLPQLPANRWTLMASPLISISNGGQLYIETVEAPQYKRLKS